MTGVGREAPVTHPQRLARPAIHACSRTGNRGQPHGLTTRGLQHCQATDVQISGWQERNGAAWRHGSIPEKPAGDRRTLIKPGLATSAAAPYIAHPPLPPALRRSG